MQLFNSMVASVLLFGCEVWGFENSNILEKVQLKFFKYLLKLKSSTPSIFVYGELGRYPLDIEIKARMIKFWSKLITNNYNLSSQMYKFLYRCHVNGHSNKWINHIENILVSNGLGNYWLGQEVPSVDYFAAIFKQRLKDQYKQNWSTKVMESPISVIYRGIKSEWGCERYLCSLPADLRIALGRFRCSNHKLPVEVGRYQNVQRENRTCTNVTVNWLAMNSILFWNVRSSRN